MQERWHKRVDHMLAAIETIETLSKHESPSGLVEYLACERAFEILSEASRHLPADVKARYGHIPWQDLADIGNVIRHAYDRVSPERLQQTAEHDVPPLKLVLLEIKTEIEPPRPPHRSTS